MKTLQYTLYIAILALIWACGGTEPTTDDDTPDDTPTQSVEELLMGSWTSTKVTRSDKEADLGEFYVEYQDSTFTSNIFDANQNYPYENGLKATVENGEIYFSEADEIFYIENISDSLLVLETDMRGLPFQFHFKRTEVE